jgi:hypothetical protein
MAKNLQLIVSKHLEASELADTVEMKIHYLELAHMESVRAVHYSGPLQ